MRSTPQKNRRTGEYEIHSSDCLERVGSWRSSRDNQGQFEVSIDEDNGDAKLTITVWPESGGDLRLAVRELQDAVRRAAMVVNAYQGAEIVEFCRSGRYEEATGQLGAMLIPSNPVRFWLGWRR